MDYLNEEDLKTWIKNKNLLRLWEAAFLVANKFSSKKFFEHPDRDDMVQEGVIHAMNFILKYEDEKGKAFTYLTFLVDCGMRYYLIRKKFKKIETISIEDNYDYYMKITKD